MVVSYLFKIDDILLVVCLLVALSSSIYFRGVNSLVLVSLIVGCSDLVMNLVRTPLWDVVSNEVIQKDYRLISWYGVWVLFNLVTALAIHLSHVRLKQAPSFVSIAISTLLFSLSCIQIMGLVDAIWIKSTLVNDIYQFGIPALNTCMAVVILVSLFQWIRYDRFSRRNSVS